MVTKICVGNYVGISITMQNFIQIGLGVSVLRMRDFLVLNIGRLSRSPSATVDWLAPVSVAKRV